jgi:hypothetical protein
MSPPIPGTSSQGSESGVRRANVSYPAKEPERHDYTSDPYQPLLDLALLKERVESESGRARISVPR